ncbi:hypothetical protein ACFYOT_34380 [Saccharothrix saharensis]|uniref:hypothetical protein n=1 Tax=Saccharothrix saharensis TaxID=571190 RepID=UPI0036C238C3
MALDYDIGATPNLSSGDGRALVGVGQKLGVCPVFDAVTGEVVWRRQWGVPLPGGGISGIQWGTSFDGRRLYGATYFAGPGAVFAVARPRAACCGGRPTRQTAARPVARPPTPTSVRRVTARR